MKIRIPSRVKFNHLPLLAALAACGLLWALSGLLTGVPFSPLWAAALLLCMSAGSVALSILRDRHSNPFSVDTADELMRAAKQRADENPAAFAAELWSDVIFRLVVTVVAYLAAMVCVLFSRFSHPAVAVLCSVTGFYYLWGLNTYLVPMEGITFSEKDYLPRDKFPTLYALAQEALGPRAKLRIYSEPGAALTLLKNGRHFSINLGAYHYAFLTGAELQALLVHSKAVTEKARFYAPVLAEELASHPPACASVPFLILTDALMQLPMTALARAYSMYEFAGAPAAERLALEVTKVSGNAPAFLSATLKHRMLSLFETMEPAARTRLFTTPEPETDLISRDYAAFLDLYKKRGGFWKALIEKELPSEGGNGLSYPELLSLTGCGAAELTVPPLESEHTALLQLLDVRFTELTEKYGSCRRKYYLEPRAVLDRYLEDTAAGKSYSALDYRPVLDACSTLTESDLLIELCDKAIAVSRNSDEAAHANFLLGRELLLRYDTSGFDLLLEAMESNENYLREGSELVERLSSLFGMRDEHERYMARVRNATQLAADRNTLAPDTISASDVLTAETILPRVQAEENLRYIVDACGEHLCKLYALDRELSDTFSAIVYIVEFAGDFAPGQKQELLEKLYNYLDSLKHYYFLYERNQLDFNPEDFDGSCIWQKQ